MFSVKERRIAIDPRGPMPGRTPTIVPTKAPMSAQRRFIGVAATWNPIMSWLQDFHYPSPVIFRMNCSMTPDGTTTPKSPVKTMKERRVVKRAVRKEISVVLNRSSRKRTKRTMKVERENSASSRGSGKRRGRRRSRPARAVSSCAPHLSRPSCGRSARHGSRRWPADRWRSPPGTGRRPAGRGFRP